MNSTAVIVSIALATFSVVWCIGKLAVRMTGVPDGFPPFTFLSLLSGVAGGFIGGSIIYALIRQGAANPNRVFFFVAVSTLVLSFGLPLRLSFTQSLRFTGVTPAAQMTLALLHTLIATAVVACLTRAGTGR